MLSIFFREGDVLLVTKLDRLARSMLDLQNILKSLQNCKVDFVVLDQQINTTTPAGKLTFNLLGSVAEFELIREGTERAIANGVKFGTKLKLKPKQVSEMMDDLRDEACEKYNISMITCYRLCSAGEVFDSTQI